MCSSSTASRTSRSGGASSRASSSSGVTLDQCWFKHGGKKYFPGVYFATEPHDRIDQATVHLPCPELGMNFHEYAHGAADWALEHGPGEDVETGND